MYWSYSFDYDWLISPDSEWLKSPDANNLLYITKVGIFVIESKNYKGWIFGTDTNKNWTEVLYTRKTWTNHNGSEKHSFYNPIMQNNTHINWLKRYLNINVPMFSLSVFSNNC